MSSRKSPDRTQQLSPVRVAPLGELTAYTVHEHELDIIAAGSPATLAFNSSLGARRPPTVGTKTAAS